MESPASSGTHECHCPPADRPANDALPVMTAPELRALLRGRRLRIRVAAGGIATLRFGADGVVHGEFPDGRHDRGTWSVHDDRYCIDWEAGPKRSCTLVHRDAGMLILRDPSGAMRGSVDTAARSGGDG